MSTEAAPQAPPAADDAPPKLGDPVPDFTGHQPFGPSGIHIAGVGNLPPNAPQPGEKDSLQREFDPAKFRPEKDSAGRWKNLRAGRKPKNAPPSDLPPADFSDVNDLIAKSTSPEVAEGLAKDIAAVRENPTAETIIGILQTALMLIGDEEGVLTKAEKEMLRGPLVRVLAKYEIGDDVLPPEAELLFAVLAIVAARLQKPKTATAWVRVKTWIVSKFFEVKGRALAADLRREAPIPAAS